MKRPALFLFELAFVAAAFVVCAVVCIQILAASRVMSVESAHLADAVALAQSAAARYQAGLPEPGEMGELKVTITPGESGTVPYGVISVSKDGRVLYTLEVAARPEVYP